LNYYPFSNFDKFLVESLQASSVDQNLTKRVPIWTQYLGSLSRQRKRGSSPTSVEKGIRFPTID